MTEWTIVKPISVSVNNTSTTVKYKQMVMMPMGHINITCSVDNVVATSPNWIDCSINSGKIIGLPLIH